MIWIEYRSPLTGLKVFLQYQDEAHARSALRYLGVQDWKVVADSARPGDPPRRERDLRSSVLGSTLVPGDKSE